jgi:hypothetical protein
MPQNGREVKDKVNRSECFPSAKSQELRSSGDPGGFYFESAPVDCGRISTCSSADCSGGGPKKRSRTPLMATTTTRAPITIISDHFRLN